MKFNTKPSIRFTHTELSIIFPNTKLLIRFSNTKLVIRLTVVLHQLFRFSTFQNCIFSWFANYIYCTSESNQNGTRDIRIYKNWRVEKLKNSLTIRNLTLQDHMNIQCNASNRHGYVFADVYLNVLGKLSFVLLVSKLEIWMVSTNACISYYPLTFSFSKVEF